MNISEEFVAEICSRTFLGFWSFPNPVGKNNKELCDFLVVSDPYIMIFSVKHINIKEQGDEEVNLERWKKRAIDHSVQQVYGADKYLQSVNSIILKDRKTEVCLPTIETRKVFRICVAIGRGERFP